MQILHSKKPDFKPAISFLVSSKKSPTVLPSQAGIHNMPKLLDYLLHKNDKKDKITFYESISLYKWAGKHYIFEVAT